MSNDLSSLKASIDIALNAISQVEADVSVLKAQVEEIDGDYPCMIPGIPGGGGGDSEGDYAFKLSATENMDGNGDPYDPPQFTVSVLGGTAQTLGGTPHYYDDTEINGVSEGDYIYVRYKNVDNNYVEIGDWDTDIHGGDPSSYTAPQDLIFVLGRISENYAGNVRQDHKGAIVMPPISNVVDIQTKLP